MALYKNILTEDERQAVSIFFETTGEFKTVEDDNENYEKILQVLEGNSEGVGEYADNEYAEGRLEVLVNPFANLAETLTSLTDRVTYSDYMVYFDNEPVDSEIADIIIRSVKAGDSKVGALVNFLEKLYSQATSTARRNLFRWISDRNITLHPSGDFIAYKGLQSFVDEDGETKFRSVFSGQAYVNNKLQNGQIVQGAGDTVTMPPSMVEENEDVACSTGLHAGTHEYASGWHQGGYFTVLINPANVISVPKDSNGQKVRVSRYTILEAIEKEYTQPVWEDEDYYDDDEFEDSEEYWGDDADDDDWVDDDDADYYSDYADSGYNEDSVDDDDDDTKSVKSLAEAAEINSPYTGGEKVLTFTYHGRERVVVVEHVEEDRVFGESIADESFGGPAPVKTFAVAKMSGVGIADLYDAYSAGLIDEDVYEKYEDITAEANRQSSWENHPSNFVVGDTGDGFGNSVDTDDTDDTEDNDSDDGISEDEYQELRESVVNLVRKFGDNTAEAVGRITGVDASQFDFQGWAEKVEKKGDEFTEKFSEALRDITRRDADED